MQQEDLFVGFHRGDSRELRDARAALRFENDKLRDQQKRVDLALEAMRELERKEKSLDEPDKKDIKMKLCSRRVQLSVLFAGTDSSEDIFERLEKFIRGTPCGGKFVVDATAECGESSMHEAYIDEMFLKYVYSREETPHEAAVRIQDEKSEREHRKAAIIARREDLGRQLKELDEKLKKEDA